MSVTVNQIQVAQGQPIIITGTHAGAEKVGITVNLGAIDWINGNLISKAFAQLDSATTWSFNVTSYLEANNKPAFGAGNYEVAAQALSQSAGWTYDNSTQELTVTAAQADPVAPTINALSVTNFAAVYYLTGTASTEPGAVTTIYLNGYATTVTPDENGKWSIASSDARWSYTEGEGENAALRDIIIYNGVYEVQAYTELQGITVYDQTSTEVAAQWVPTVDPITVPANGGVVLTGTSYPSSVSTLVIRFGDTVLETAVEVGSDGSWSFNMSQYLSELQYPLSEGQYEVEISYIDWSSWPQVTVVGDTSAGELTITGGAGPTDDADNLTGTTGDDTIDLLAGDDTYSGGAGNDTITGGAGQDELSGDAGNDTFIVKEGDLDAGEIYNGGADDDTLELRGSGTFDLTTVTLISIDRIKLADANGIDVTVADLAQAALIGTAVGENDIVRIADISAGEVDDRAAAVFELLGKGVETVVWGTEGAKTTVTLANENTLKIVDWRGIDNQITFENGLRKTQVIDDVDNKVGFDTITIDYDAKGLQLKRTQINDDGAKTVTDYVGGVISKATHTDTSANGKGVNWSYAETNYENGKPTDAIIKYDNGTQTVTDYENGLRKTVTQTDNSADGKAAGWVSIVTEYADDGKTLVQRTQTDDNGAKTVTDYVGGVISKVTKTDTSPDGKGVNWSYAETNYEGGKPTDAIIKYDNGTQTVTDYENGVRKTVTQTDNSANGKAAAWKSISTEYGDDGKTLVQRTQVDDNGVETVTDYEGGLRKAVTQTDNSADGKAAKWASIVTEYATDGKTLAQRTQVDDNGVETVTDYEGGVISKVTQTDTSYGGKGVNWVDAVTIYTQGAISSKDVWFDNGDHLVQTYISASLISTVLTKENGRKTVTGGIGDNELVGGDYEDSINGGLGDDILMGCGGTDVFVFAKGGFGSDTISDFINNEDRLDLRAYGVTGKDAYSGDSTSNNDFARLGFNATEDNGDVVISVGSHGTITLQNFALADLDASDFM